MKQIQILAIAFLFIACSVKERDPVTPAPTIKKVSTDFFFEYSADRTNYKPKRFVFGSMSEDKTGTYSRYTTDHFNVFGTYGSSNIEFEYNEDGTELIGKLVNPTYPNNKNKWQVLLTFKINTYYEENPVDPTGRRSDDVARRSDRSDPRARTFMDLELSSLSYRHINRTRPWSSWLEKVVEKVEDVEWSEDGNFLGFTATSTTAGLGSNLQTTDRINIMAIHDSDGAGFQETPYHKENDRYTQVLHITSQKKNHFGERLRAAHWDINSVTKKQYTIYLHNFPEKYLQLAIDAIEEWNDVFAKEDIVGYRPFKYEVTDRKYAFDLRYHTIHWVDDKALSAEGPLGLANSAIDIETGRILWTGSIIWGGMIDEYAARDIPSSALTSANMSGSSYMPSIMRMANRRNMNWTETRFNHPFKNSFTEDFISYLTSNVMLTGIRAAHTPEDLVQIQSQIDLDIELQERDVERGLNREDLDNYVRAREALFHGSRFLDKDQLDYLMVDLHTQEGSLEVDLDRGYNDLSESPFSFADISYDLGFSLNEPEDEHIQKEINFLHLGHAREAHEVEYFANSSHDHDVKAIDALVDLKMEFAVANAAAKERGEIIDIDEVKRSMLKKTISHEIGHTLGLAHNFKSNIMPKKGTVPNEGVYDRLVNARDNKMTNASSIMGYPDGLTTVYKTADEQKPGPNDENRIKMLYTQQYPVYDPELKGAGSYEWLKLPENGLMEPKIEGAKKIPVAFLPGCNDMAASWYVDPFCNRHDRGYDARTLVRGYFDRLDKAYSGYLQNRVPDLENRAFWRIESYLWGMSGRTFSRSRLFYDYMRYHYKNEISKMITGNIDETFQNFQNFSQDCKQLVEVSNSYEVKSQEKLAALSSNEGVRRFMEKDVDDNWVISEFGDLCIASGLFLDKANQMVSIYGPEYTQVDYTDRLVPGGIRIGDSRTDYGQFWGQWTEMSVMPLRFRAMQSVLMPYPMIMSRWAEMPLHPYNTEQTMYSMSTLYPKSYLKVINTLVQRGIELDHTRKGPFLNRSLMYLGYFLSFHHLTQDYKNDRIPRQILDAIEDQTQFRISRAIIEVTANKKESTEFAKTFTGTVYNRFNSNGREGLGPVYFYTYDRIVTRQQSNSLTLALTPVRWRTPAAGLSAAIKLDYEIDPDFEDLSDVSSSPRKFLTEAIGQAVKECIEGENKDGLQSYFKERDDFDGILIPYDVHETDSAYKEFKRSVADAIDNFVEDTGFDRNICGDALEKQRVLVLGSALLGGYIFQDTLKALNGGSN